jgi:ATP adenylyltransferase
LNKEYFFSFDKLSYLKGKKPDGCILCLIRDRAREVVDLSVYRDEYFIVSMNLYPYNPGHLLVFPRRHLEDIRQLTSEEEARLVRLQRYLLDTADKILEPSGFNIGYNMGLSAGASIAHLHLHIIPRYPRELGIADLIAGKRVLVESPVETAERFRAGIAQAPFSKTSS